MLTLKTDSQHDNYRINSAFKLLTLDAIKNIFTSKVTGRLGKGESRERL